MKLFRKIMVFAMNCLSESIIAECHGTGGVFFEVTLDKGLVWSYLNQFPLMANFNLFPYLISGNQVYKVRRYEPDYPGLKYLFE